MIHPFLQFLHKVLILKLIHLNQYHHAIWKKKGIKYKIQVEVKKLFLSMFIIQIYFIISILVIIQHLILNFEALIPRQHLVWIKYHSLLQLFPKYSISFLPYYWNEILLIIYLFVSNLTVLPEKPHPCFAIFKKNLI